MGELVLAGCSLLVLLAISTGIATAGSLFSVSRVLPSVLAAIRKVSKDTVLVRVVGTRKVVSLDYDNKTAPEEVNRRLKDAIKSARNRASSKGAPPSEP